MRQWLWLVCLAITACQQPPLLQQWQAPAQEPALDITPSTARPEPQKPFELRLQGHWPVTATALEPQYPSYITEMRVLDFRRSVTDVDGERRVDIRLTVQADVGGVYRIAPIPIALEYPDGRSTVVRSLPLVMEVTLEAARDVTDIRDIKPLRPTPWQPGAATWVLIALGFTALLATAAALVYRWRRRRPPALTALEQLEQVLRPYLRDSGQRALDRDEAFALSEAARRYVEQRHGLRALEMTGTEFVAAASTLADSAAVVQLQELARSCRELEDIKFRPEGSAALPAARLAARLWDAAHALEQALRALEAQARGAQR